jgi:hypothetical protein
MAKRSTKPLFVVARLRDHRGHELFPWTRGGSPFLRFSFPRCPEKESFFPFKKNGPHDSRSMREFLKRSSSP